VLRLASQLARDLLLTRTIVRISSEAVALSYVVITPVRNDPRNLYRLGQSMKQQTRPPKLWVIVDDGSTDDTFGIVMQLRDEIPFVRLLHIVPNDQPIGDGRIGLRDKRAFEMGLEYADAVGADVIFKVDSDITFGRDYCASLVARFEEDSRLGIAGGQGYEIHRS
jgi:biofilm PGA synthesis N-glycosyltransferase PgaC